MDPNRQDSAVSPQRLPASSRGVHAVLGGTVGQNQADDSRSDRQLAGSHSFIWYLDVAMHMSDPEEVLSDSPADFDSSFAYALHPEMRRLIIVAVVGSLILPIGLAMFLDPGFVIGPAEQLLRQMIGLLLAIVGAALLFGGLVGALFKIVTDANIVAEAHE